MLADVFGLDCDLGDRHHRHAPLRRCRHPEAGPQPRLGQDTVREGPRRGQEGGRNRRRHVRRHSPTAGPLGRGEDAGRLTRRPADPGCRTSTQGGPCHLTSSPSPTACGTASCRRPPSIPSTTSAGSSRSPTASASAPPSPTSPPSPPRTASSWSTPAAPRWPRSSTTTSAPGARLASTPPSTPTATSTTSSACRSGKQEAAAEGWAAPEVIAHHALPARFDRYIFTAGYNTIINRRQFGFTDLQWPTEYRYPDRTYHDTLELSVGGLGFSLRHEKGETDDHTVTWQPDTRVLCCGDLFIWASPNAGNPQKVQRYPREWAAALRRMLELRRRVPPPRPRLPRHRSRPRPYCPHRHGGPPRLPGRPDPGRHERGRAAR